LIFYTFLNISRVITIISEERIKLNLLKKLKSSSIGGIDEINFWKKKYEQINKENEKLSDDNTSLRSSLSFSQSKLDDDRNSMKTLNKQQNESAKKIKDMILKFVEDTDNQSTQALEFKTKILTEFERFENNKKSGPSFLRVS